MIKQIGTKIYYSNKTGEVLLVVGDMEGYVNETSFADDVQVYDQLKSIDMIDINVIYFEFGEYPKLSQGAKSVKINLETKIPIFTY